MTLTPCTLGPFYSNLTNLMANSDEL
jgi:hypothetical protein